MPLIIDEDAFNTAVAKGPVHTPKVFHSEITGTGGANGRINNQVHPADPDMSYEPYPKVNAPTKDQIDGETTARTLVTQPWLEAGLEQVINEIYRADQDRRRRVPAPDTAELATHPYLFQMSVPPLLRTREVVKARKTTSVTDRYMFDLGAAITGMPDDYRLWLNLEPQLVVLRDRGVLDASTGRNIWTHTVHIRYRVELYVFHQSDHTEMLVDDDGVPVTDDSGVALSAPSLTRIPAVTTVPEHDPLSFDEIDSFVSIHYAFDVAELLEEVVPDLINYLRGGRGVATSIDLADFAEWSEHEFGLYQRLCAAAETFSTEQIAEPVLSLVQQLYRSKFARAAASGDLPSVASMAPALEVLTFLDNFNTIPLEAYSKIYAGVVGLDNGGPIASNLVGANVQLKQNAELSRLKDIKAHLPVPGPINTTNWSMPARYSEQQRNAISTLEPLVMVVAGAGAGKSTVVTERISMLTRGAGVDPESIQVWSFTNAAADEIRDRNPGIVSKTIARAIHEIYMTNYPNQQLSTMDTIANSIKIHYGAKAQTDDVLVGFATRVANMAKPGGESNANIMAMNAFIEQHTSEVVTILEEIGQTTLELEIILSYLLIDNERFIEPFASPDYLIIDEVQDNSAFQFVYAMRYAVKHKCSLYLVGDASQTLYEFRAANPKALTALEASGVFEVCKLSTNYRSAQEILDFANLHLAGIEANRFAKIQLDSNSLVQSTPESFQKAVRLESRTCRTRNAFQDNLGRYLSSERLRDYFSANLEAGQTTVVLAHTRKHVEIAEKALKSMFPNKDVLNLTSERIYSSTTFSSFVARYWDEITSVDPALASWTFTKQMQNHLPSLEANAAKITGIIDDQLRDWWLTNNGRINIWLGQLSANVISAEEFFLNLRQTVLDYEINNNGIRQSLLNQKNAMRKEEMLARDPKLMVSTIHGVKGMEFDHVVLVLSPETRESAKDESYKRTLYVALTRAKLSEVILAGVSDAKPRIEEAYRTVVEALEQRAQAAAEALVGQAVDEIEGDGPEQDLIEAEIDANARIEAEIAGTAPLNLTDEPNGPDVTDAAPLVLPAAAYSAAPTPWPTTAAPGEQSEQD